MGGHSTPDDPTRYVPKELFAEWEKKDPIQRFEKYLAAAGIWTPKAGAAMAKEAEEEAAEAGRAAERVPKPGLETIFSDVFRDIPTHIRRQGEAAFDLARRKGDAAAGGGEFPL
jgi:TPP-dependent pyruvate/acetoin dehydrogenase alpha subunit